MAEGSSCNCCCHGNASRNPVPPAYPLYPSYYPAYPFCPPHMPYPYPYPALGLPTIGYPYPPAIGQPYPPATVGLPHHPYFSGYYLPHPTHGFPGYPLTNVTTPPAPEPATKSECCKKQESTSDKTSVNDVSKLMKNKLENLSKYGQYRWVPTSIREDNSFVIDDGLLIGTDVHGSDIYAARAKFSGDMIPGKYVPTTNICTVTMCGEEASVDDFEVLIPMNDEFKWVAAMNGAVPPGAMPAGVCANGEKYYYGRVKHHDALIPGKMQPSHGNSYYGIDGDEFSSKKYEILVLM